MIVVEQVCNSIVKEIFLLPKFEMKNLIQVVRIKMTLLGRKFFKKKADRQLAVIFSGWELAGQQTILCFILQKLDKETLQNFYHFMFKNVWRVCSWIFQALFLTTYYIYLSTYFQKRIIFSCKSNSLVHDPAPNIGSSAALQHTKWRVCLTKI